MTHEELLAHQLAEHRAAHLQEEQVVGLTGVRRQGIVFAGGPGPHVHPGGNVLVGRAEFRGVAASLLPRSLDAVLPDSLRERRRWRC
jgi:hypothetical protein